MVVLPSSMTSTRMPLGMAIRICTAGRQLRRWRDGAGVQDVYDRIMALMAS